MRGSAPRSRLTAGRNFIAVEMRDLLARDYVAASPSIALDKIRRIYSCELTVRGGDCAGIMQLRRLIASIDDTGRYARCLLITAPHTHWGEQTIVESFDTADQTYRIGSQLNAGEAMPYSFLFSADGAIAYEWADRSVPLDPAELAEAWDFIDRLNSLVASEFLVLPIPLGITIDHRFKKSIFDQQIFSFAELPPTDAHGCSVVRPVLESVIETNPVYPGRLQAAWFSAPDDTASSKAMGEWESETLSRLEKIVAQQSPEQARRFVEELESYLRTK
jgi:hypothetical protein